MKVSRSVGVNVAIAALWIGGCCRTVSPVLLEARFAGDGAPAPGMHVILSQRGWFPHKDEADTDRAGRARLTAAQDRYLFMNVDGAKHVYIATVPNPHLEGSGLWCQVKGYVDPADRVLEYRLIDDSR